MDRSKLKAIVVMIVLGCALTAHAQSIPTTPIQNPADEEWQTFQDRRYTFQFEYPAKWSTEDQQGAGGLLMLRNEQKNEIITISEINLAVIGISYCGAYPQDSRCEVFTTESGDAFIDWNVDGEAYAMLSAPNGTSGAGITLHKVNPETKTAFRKILSTFKFIK